jgi:hypothetical protein
MLAQEQQVESPKCSPHTIPNVVQGRRAWPHCTRSRYGPTKHGDANGSLPRGQAMFNCLKCARFFLNSTVR